MVFRARELIGELGGNKDNISNVKEKSSIIIQKYWRGYIQEGSYYMMQYLQKVGSF